MSGQVNAVIDSGLYITKLLEPAPIAEMFIQWPEWKDECRRPMFVLIAAVKAAQTTPQRWDIQIV